ncbi:DUF1661 domain-containing protein [Porphyromonas gingivalis]
MREFFTSRTKIKKFSNHIFWPHG